MFVQVHRDLPWRVAETGAPLTAEDLTRLAKKGLKTEPGMPAFDFVRLVQHAMSVTISKKLQFFVMPSKLRPLGDAEIRYYSPSKQRWMRTNNSSTWAELPDSHARASSLPLLVLRLDQKQVGLWVKKCEDCNFTMEKLIFCEDCINTLEKLIFCEDCKNTFEKLRFCMSLRWVGRRRNSWPTQTRDWVS